jgi:hypothetical protein
MVINIGSCLGLSWSSCWLIMFVQLELKTDDGQNQVMFQNFIHFIYILFLLYFSFSSYIFRECHQHLYLPCPGLKF